MTSYKSEHIIFIKSICFSLTIIHKYIEYFDLKKNRKKNAIMYIQGTQIFKSCT